MRDCFFLSEDEVPEFERRWGELGKGMAFVESFLVLTAADRAEPSLCKFTRAIARSDGLDAIQVEFYPAASRSADLLARANEEARRHERASEAKTAFLANISHEIRTPMNAVVGFCDLLGSTPLSADQSECVAAIHSSGQVLVELINQVLDYSKIESGRIDLVPDTVDLLELVHETISIMGGRARLKGLAIELEAPSLEIPLVLADSIRMKQILMNLLSNAIKFTMKGKITVGIASGPTGTPGCARVEFRVADTGVGIEPSVSPNLFEPFCQAQSDSGRRCSGTGLGLAIVRSLCRAMGGDVQVSSEPGEGSIFVVELLLPTGGKVDSGGLRSKELPIVSPMEKFAQGEDKLRVLVIDDNPNNLLITAKLSEHLGYEVTTVNSGVLALAALEKNTYSILLMDIRMAPIDGLETCKKIRAGETGEANRDVYIIALTAHALSGDREKCLQSGMNDYLPKPLSLEQLGRSLNTAKEAILA